MKVVRYERQHEDRWDEFCAKCINATFLHTRRFLSYHGDRFVDCSSLLFAGDKLVGLFPAAHAKDDHSRVTSHPGATFGGIVHQGWLSGSRMLEALSALVASYREQGARTLLYKAVPYFHCKNPAQDDLYGLFRLRAQRVRCDLSSTIDLASQMPLHERRRRSLRRAQRAVTTSWDTNHLDALWDVVCGNLSRKHSAKPVHSREELASLQKRFPEDIRVCSALSEGRIAAGVVLFNSPQTWHAQYIASDERGYETSALDAVFAAIMERARSASARYFDFGISNEDNGMTLNEGLYRFKSEFGGGGTVHEFYELDLS